MFEIYDSRNALRTILKRIPPDEQHIPPSVLDSIEQIFGERITPYESVARILKSVRLEGDEALRAWSYKLDGLTAKSFRVPQAEIESAKQKISAEQLDALEKSSIRIGQFHQRQPMTSWMTQDMGGTLGQLIRPIQRVGLYVPAGTAPLPSSVLMSAIPAKVAGVPDLVIVSPPDKRTGKINPMTLAACEVAGVDEVYMLGGAQAIAALAFGTQSVPAVDKIFGPGNLFVTLAKQQVYGVVGIDGLAGPTETVVIADEFANPSWVAADLLAQAEHDVLASAILLTPSQEFAEKVQVEIAHQLESLSRAEIIIQSLQNRGGAVITTDLDQAAELSNRYAPEHLCLAVEDPWSLSEKITAAGGIFVGENSFEVLGDYVAGPSHVMPTGGSARFASPLNVWDFIHIVSLIAVNPETARQIGPTATIIAQSEGLTAHANASRIRYQVTE